MAEICARYASAAEAYGAGAYYVAMVKAMDEGNAEIYAAALLMCGWIERGLSRLAGIGAAGPEARLAQAFAHWCLGDVAAARAICGAASRAESRFAALDDLLARARLNVVVIHGVHTARGIPDDGDPSLAVRAIAVGNEAPAPLAALARDGFAPDLVLVLDVYGHRLPPDVFEARCPVAFWVYDFDFHIAQQHDDLARADVIVVGSSSEQLSLHRIHGPSGARVAAFVTHDVHTSAARFVATAAPKSCDIVHTGTSFYPAMRDKARFLYEIASLDSPAPRIDIRHGFLADERYRASLASARFVAVYDRFAGGLVTRAVDAACVGTTILSPKGASARLLLDEAGAAIVEVDETAVEDELPRLLARRDEAADAPSPMLDNLRQMFPPSPLRERRLVKYALFQAILAGAPRRARAASAATSHSEAALHTRACRLAQDAMSRCAERPLDAGLRAAAERALARGVEMFPRSLPLHFLLGQLQWMYQEKAKALAAFRAAIAHWETGTFDPRREDIRFNVLRSAHEMMPLEDYCGLLARALAGDEGAASGPRRVIAATAHAYLALERLQDDDLARGIAHLQDALAIYPTHFAAARLHAKAVAAAGADPRLVLAAVDRAIALYPPVASELLPLALAAHERLGETDAATRRVRRWGYFIARVQWSSEPPVPAETWSAIVPYLARLPAALQTAVGERANAAAQS